MWIKNNHIVILIISCLAIFFVNLDAMYVNIMEARNFITAREMLHDGNWLLTTLNGEARYQKPPLPTWITAFSASIFGLKSLIGLRIPAALMATLLIFCSYRLGFLITRNRMYALISSLILSTSFYIIFAGRNGQWDIFTHAFMVVCIYQLYLFFTREDHRYRYALLASIFFGLSFMSKGPVSLYALLLPFLISFGFTYRYSSLKRRIVPIILFLVIGLVISGWWYYYTYIFDPQTVSEITQKETANWNSYNVRPFYYYWSFFTQSGIWTIPAFVGLLYPYLKKKVSDKKAYTFTFLWTIISVILLSVIPEKKSRYLLPVLIPLALNTGFYLEYIINNFRMIRDIRETIPVYFNFGLIALIGITFPIGGYIFLADDLSGNWFWFVALSIVLFGTGILIIRMLYKKRIRNVFFGTILFIASIMVFGMPMAGALSINPEYKSLSELNSWQEETELKVYEYRGFSPELIWAYGKPIPMIENNGVVTIPELDSFAVLISEENLDLFKKTFAGYSIEKITRYDMNPRDKESRSHRPRLWRDLYVVNKP
jgi:4-amino-4-deoxy-L-arabinose transferase-like glycosyltransferase